MSETPDWATAVPSTSNVHLDPSLNNFQRPDIKSLAAQAGKLVEIFLRKVVLAIVGSFTPNVPAFDQLQAWASQTGGHIASTWNNFWAGVFGSSTGSTGTADDVTTAAAYVTATANTADANATLALGNIDDIAQAITGGYYGTAGTTLPADVSAALADINSRLEALEP